jgi:transposase
VAPNPWPTGAEPGQLRRENARLRQRLEQAEAIIDIQKKVASLLEMTMPSAPDATRNGAP